METLLIIFTLCGTPTYYYVPSLDTVLIIRKIPKTERIKILQDKTIIKKALHLDKLTNQICV